jgi:DNA repair protein RadC
VEYTLGVMTVKGEAAISTPEDVLKILAPFRDLPREVMVVIHLSPDLVPKSVQKAAIGSSQACCFETKDIFREAIVREASAIIMAHNHPWQKLIKPTKEDIELTEDMFRVGKAARMPLLDHIIVGPESYYSFRKEGIVFPKSDVYTDTVSTKRSAGKTRALRMIAKISTGFVIR